MAIRIREAIEAEAFQAGSLRITTSLGVGEYDGSGSADLTRIIKRADRALYRAKAGGRNQVALADP